MPRRKCSNCSCKLKKSKIVTRCGLITCEDCATDVLCVMKCDYCDEFCPLENVINEMGDDNAPTCFNCYVNNVRTGYLGAYWHDMDCQRAYTIDLDVEHDVEDGDLLCFKGKEHLLKVSEFRQRLKEYDDDPPRELLEEQMCEFFYEESELVGNVCEKCIVELRQKFIPSPAELVLLFQAMRGDGEDDGGYGGGALWWSHKKKIKILNEETQEGKLKIAKEDVEDSDMDTDSD